MKIVRPKPKGRFAKTAVTFALVATLATMGVPTIAIADSTSSANESQQAQTSATETVSTSTETSTDTDQANTADSTSQAASTDTQQEIAVSSLAGESVELFSAAGVTLSILNANGDVVSDNDTITPADFRDSNGTARVNVNLSSSQTTNTVILVLPAWFSWYQVNGTSDYAVSVFSGTDANGQQGTDNVLAILFNDISGGEQTFGLDFNFRLNDSYITAASLNSLENGGLQDMVFTSSLNNTAGTTDGNSVTLGYDWDDPAAASVTDLYVGPVGNLYTISNTHITPGVVETGIYDDIDQNDNTLSKVTIPATDPYRYGRAVSSITISLDDDAADIYQINGLTSSTESGLVSSYDNYTVEVSSDGKTLTLTPNDASASIDLSDLSQDRLLGLVDIGFRLVDNGTYDRDSWYDALTSGVINSGDLLHVTVNYQDFTSSGAETSSTEGTSTMTVASYEETNPGVRQNSADTSTYLPNSYKYGDDPITVAAVVDSAGAADQTVWIGENLNNLVSYSENDGVVSVSIPTDASGYALVTEYPYEVRGTEYQIRPKYTETASTLDDQFSPGGFELEKVVFTLSDGSTVEVSADNSTFASDWNEALSSNSTMTVTADQLGIDASFDSSNEADVTYVTKVTQVFKTASPSIISNTSNYWSFRMTKWSMTTYEEDGTTVLGTGSLTHANGTVEANGARWYPITSTLYTDESLGTQVASSEHSIQVSEEKCPELDLAVTSGGQWQYNQWKYESENETGSYLGIRIAPDTDLSSVQTTLTNPTIDIYHYWMDNVYTWTGEMDITPAMAGWTVTYGVTTYAKQAAGEAVEVRTMQLPSAEDFQDSSQTNEDGTITIDLLPDTDGDETGSDWEYIAASSAVDVGTDGFGRAEPVEISFHYDGDWDVTTVADEDGDGIIDNNGTDGFLVKNIVASSRTIDPDGQYSYYLWWDGGHITKMCYQWDNCVDNDAGHLSTATSDSGVGNWGHDLAATVEQLGAQILEPTGLSADWTGTLSQGSTSTISGSLTLTANPIGSPEWQPSGDVLYLEFPDENILFAGNASIDGVSDPDAYVTTINGTRYLVIHDNASSDTVKSATTDNISTDWQHPTSNVTYESLEVSFDVYTLPTASTSSATTVIGDNTYLDFSNHQYYANVSNNPSDGTYHTAIQKKGTLNWNGQRGGLGNGACVDNPLGVHTKADITDRYWAIKTTGVSLTPALNTNLGLQSYSGTNDSDDDSPDSLVLATGIKDIIPDEQDQMESLIVLSAGENGLTNGEIIVQIPDDGTTVSDSTTSYTNTTGLSLRGAVKQYGTLADGEELTFQVSTDGTNYVDVTDDTDWSSVRYVKASVNALSANESVMFTLPLSAASDTQAGDYAYLHASAIYTVPEGSRSAQGVSGYYFKNASTDPDPVTYAISGTKTLTQDDEAISMTDGQFQVSVKADEDNDTSGYTGFTAGNIDVSAYGSFSTDDITFTKAGTYTFYVSEVDGGNALYTYDDTEYTVTVTVTTNSDNALTTTTEISNGTEMVDAITFANTKQSEQQITVTKQWIGFAGSSATVHLLADGVEVDSATLTADNNWTDTFSVDAITSDGNDIAYTITEDAIDNYASQVTGSESEGFTATNYYGGITVDDPPVSKVISGDEPTEDATFTFTFTAEPDKSTLPDGMASDEMPMPNGASDQSITTSITGEGTSEFGNLVFYNTGTYVYQVYENNDGVSGYTYDDSVYEVTYVVTEEDGALVSNRTITKNGEVVSAATYTFENVYQADESGTGTSEGSGSSNNGNGSGNGSAATPSTGDSTLLLTITLIAAFAAAVIGIVVAADKRRRNE